MSFSRFKKGSIILVFLSILILLSACESSQPPPPTVQKELLIYCGTSLLAPVRVIADRIEQQENCIVKIIANGSGRLYRSITINKQGDLYLPGSESSMKKSIENKLIRETALVGFTRAAFIVAKGNPLHITADIKSILNPEYRVVLGASCSGSIGEETKNILMKTDSYGQAISKALYLTNDSRGLAEAIANNKADLVINWAATAEWAGNKEKMEAIALPSAIFPPHKLFIGLLHFSRHPQIARKYIEYAASPAGKQIFSAYGFGKVNEKNI